MSDPNTRSSLPPAGEPWPDWDGLTVADRYQRLSQIAEGFELILEAALEHEEFADLVLDLRDKADQLLNDQGEFAYIGPQECWENNLPLSVIGWRWPGTVGR